MRKFDSVSFWKAVADVMPPSWDPSVHVAAFDLLFGRCGTTPKPSGVLASVPAVSVPQIVPAILASLDYGLQSALDFTDPSLLSPTREPLR